MISTISFRLRFTDAWTRSTQALLVFFFLYTPFLEIGGFTVHLPYFVVALLAGYFVWVMAVRGVATEYVGFILAFVVGYAWILVTSLVNGAIDFSIQLLYVNGLATMCAAYGIVCLVMPSDERERRKQSDSVCFSIFIAGVLHAFVMVVVFFVPSAAELLYSVVVLGEKGQSFVEQMIRSPGLTTGGGDALSVIQGIALIFGVQSVANMKKPLMLVKLTLYTLAFLLLLFSILLSARTGFVVVALGLALFAIRNGWPLLLTPRITRATTFKTIALAIGVVVVGVPLYSAITNSEYTRFVSRALEPFFTYAETGRIATSSSDRIVNTMYFLPDSDRDRLVGTGNFGRDRSLPVIPSDVGYVRTIFGAGLIGTILMYGALLFPFVVAVRSSSFDRQTTWLIGFLVLAIFIVNVKVFHFAGMRESFKALCLLTSAALLAGKGASPVDSSWSGLRERTHTVRSSS